MTSAMTEPKITLTVAQIQHLARLAEAARFSGSLTVGAPELLALCTLALQALAMQPRPTHRHIKTGGLYQMLGSGAVQSERPLTDMQAVVIYRAMKDGTLWAREFHEFHDAARFEPLTSLPEPK